MLFRSAQNVKMGMRAKAMSGEWCGGIPPFGYCWVTMEGTENHGRRKSRLEVVEREAEAVRLMFQLYASGKGYKAIVGRINREGYRTKLDNAFSVAQIKSILTNPVYIGKVRYDVRISIPILLLQTENMKQSYRRSYGNRFSL